jgi:Na+-transporting NADH:ubiquinone oxidoreductase subunit A
MRARVISPENPELPRIKGVRLPDQGAPRQEVGPVKLPDCVGLIGADYPGMKLRAVVAEGDRVSAGQPVLHDHAMPERVVTSPVSGTVEDIVIGARRQVARMVIRRGTGEARRFDPATADSPDRLRRLMLSTGLWAALLRRPFGRVPPPDETPAAIVVTAMATEPGAADPAPLIRAEAGNFNTGIQALSRLGGGPVFVCQAPGAELARIGERVRVAVFSGAHPAGMPGVHVERLCPATASHPVWQMGYADVLALGHVLRDGALPADRVVSLSGPAAADPRLLRLPIGADIEALAGGEARGTAYRVLSGPLLSGQEGRFLRRRHVQISLTPREAPAPHGRKGSTLQRAALIPNAATSRSLGPDFPAVALLRALSVGEVEQAERMGVLGLLEDDMALASYLTGGGEDYGVRLRAVLDRLEAA